MFQQKLLDSGANYSNNKSHVQVYFNGLCQPCNPGGTACFAFIVKNKENTIHSEYVLVTYDSTNNVAEYTGMIRALEWLIKNNLTNEKIMIRGDSLLVINQIDKNLSQGSKYNPIIP
jgi:ribonuclease HI